MNDNKRDQIIDRYSKCVENNSFGYVNENDIGYSTQIVKQALEEEWQMTYDIASILRRLTEENKQYLNALDSCYYLLGYVLNSEDFKVVIATVSRMELVGELINESDEDSTSNALLSKVMQKEGNGRYQEIAQECLSKAAVYKEVTEQHREKILSFNQYISERAASCKNAKRPWWQFW